jgi:membrane-bound serine protease (ClpP class)
VTPRRSVTTVVLALGLLSLGASSSAQSELRPVRVIELKGIIDPTTSDFLRGQIAAAQEEASALVVQLDTPGGLDVSMRQIITEMLESRVPIVVWIAPRGARAASAGTFITYAAHLAYMADATELGAATPVNLGGGETPDTLEEKATNDAVAFITELARLRDRNVEWAEDAVREAASIGATEAVDIDVVDAIASSVDDVLEAMDGEMIELAGEKTVELETWDEAGARPSVDIERIGMNPLQRLLHFVTQPEVAFLLVSFGTLAILFELYTSGIGLSGILGLVATLLGFYGLTILPTNWAAVALIVAGMVFFLVDIYVPGLGVWTVGGAAALTGGGLLLFSGAAPALRLSPWAIVLVVGTTVPFFAFAMTAALRLRRRPSVIGSESMVGLIGEARTDIAAAGTVLAKGTLWQARSSGDAIPAGSKVRIQETQGLTLVVGRDEEEGT